MDTKRYFKITNEKETHDGVQYVDGLNILDKQFEAEDSFYIRQPHFSDAKNIFKFIHTKSFFVREITLPLSDPDFKMIRVRNDIWRANRMIFGQKLSLSDFSTIKYLIELGADLNNDVIKYADAHGYFLEMFKYLISSNIDFVAGRDSIVRIACENNYLEVVEHLVKTMDSFLKVYGNLSLFCSSNKGHFELVKYLIEKGANPGAAIDPASENGHTEIVKFVIDLEVDPQFDNNSPICSASKNGHLDIVKYLVSKGADFRVRNDDALVFASMQGHLEVVKFLIEKGADPKSESSLHWASYHGHLEVVKYLIEQSIDPSDNFRKAIRAAIGNNHFDVIKYLVEKGADINGTEGYVLLAFEQGHLEIVNFLIRKGVNLNLLKRKEYIINRASKMGNLDIVKFMVETGGNFTTCDNYAIRYAARNGHLDIVKYLIEQGADPTACNGYALKWASRKGHTDVVNSLRVSLREL